MVRDMLGWESTKRFDRSPTLMLSYRDRGVSTTACGHKLTHPFYTMDMEIPAVVGIDLLTAAKLVIDVMNRCVYSHHHACLEVEPATSEKNGGPVLCVDNATTFTSYGATATPSTTVVSIFDHTVLTSQVSDTGGFLSPEVDATPSPSSDAPTRPSLEASEFQQPTFSSVTSFRSFRCQLLRPWNRSTL